MIHIPKSLLRYTLAFALSSFAISSQAEKLVLLHTNDTHSQIDPFAEDDLGGIARRKVAIDSVRAEHKNVVLIDAGDIVQGTLFFNLYKGEVEEKLMNALGYDLRILGNHEFDNGMEDLQKNLTVANAELLCSNYNFDQTVLKDVFKPYAIKEFDGKKIAFMPINLQPKGMISDRNVVGVKYIDAIEAANHLAWYLKNIEHADAVVAITHIGYEPDVELIKSSKDIDMVIGGHSHTLLNPSDPKSQPYIVKNAEGKDVLVAQTGKGGRYLGEITVDLDQLSALPIYKLIKIDKRLDSKVDPEIENTISPYRGEIDRLNSNPVAKSARFLEKDGSGLLNFAADFVEMRGKELAGDIDLAIINKGGLRNSIGKGVVTEGQIITLMPFFNRIQVIEVPGSNLIEAFNVMAKANGNGVSANVSASFDPSTGKCTDVKISGKDIAPDKTYKVATIDYLSAGGDYMQPLVDHKLIAESKNYLFEDMLNYFRTGKRKTINPSETKRMKPIK